MTKAKGDSKRRERLGRALRENLKRRKAQARARAAAGPQSAETAHKAGLSPQSNRDE